LQVRLLQSTQGPAARKRLQLDHCRDSRFGSGTIYVVTRPSRLRVTAPSRCRAGKLYHYPHFHRLEQADTRSRLANTYPDPWLPREKLSPRTTCISQLLIPKKIQTRCYRCSTFWSRRQRLVSQA
jgi:hypothetical protein